MDPAPDKRSSQHKLRDRYLNKYDMETFSPASNIWTLRYDQFGGICWQNSATQELYYIPPGQPPTLPPRSLANGVRPNLSNNRIITPSFKVHPSEYFGGPVHFNSYNPALGVPEAAREGPASFVGYPQPLPSPSMLTDDGNQCLPPRCLPNAPRRYYPNDPYSTPAVTARTHAPPLQQSQAGGTGMHVNNNSILEVPEAAKRRPASIIEGMGPYPRPPTSRAEDATRGFPPTESVKAPFPSLPPEPNLTANADDRAKASLLLGGREKGQFDSSAMTVTETARLRPKCIAEDKEPHPSLPMARVGDAEHKLTTKSLSNAPRSISNGHPFTPDATRGAEASLVRVSPGYGEREQFGNNSVLGVTETARLRPKAIPEDKKPHISIPMTSAEDAQRGVSEKDLSNAPRSNIPNDPPFTSNGTVGAEASLIWGTGERKQFGKRSSLGVPDARRLRAAPIAEGKVPYSTTPMSRTEDAKHELPRKTLADTSPLSYPLGSYPTTSIKHRAEASLRLGNGEREQFGNNSTLKVPAGVELRPDSTAEDTKPRPSPLVSMAEDAKYESSRKRLSNAPCSNTIQDPTFNATASGRAEASLISSKASVERGQFDNNSALKIPETAPESVPGTNPRPSASMSRAEEAKQWSRKRDDRGNEYYFNTVTRESQYKKPDCLKKYTCRR